MQSFDGSNMKRDWLRQGFNGICGEYDERTSAVEPSVATGRRAQSGAYEGSVASLTAHDSSKDYSTFSSPARIASNERNFIRRASPYRTIYDYFRYLAKGRKGRHDPTGSYVQKAIEHNRHQVTTSTWKVIIVVSFTVAFVAYLHGSRIRDRYRNFMPAEWHWDHNIYIPRDSTGDPVINHQDAPVALIAQIVPGTALHRLEDISSRPNRAYARQWGLDFARYDAGRSSYNPRACFEKVAVLNDILDRQNNNTGDLIPRWPHHPRVQYDSILLLPPDAILTELDTNIIDDILSHEKLVAIAGWSHHKFDSSSDVILYNLRHRHAETVARLWLEMVTPIQVTCGANNDLEMLVNAVAEVMDDSEDLNDIIEPLTESKDGFIGKRVIKSIPSSVPGPRTALMSNSLQETATLLQETADSVCYRFYPKCEVLTYT